MTVRARPVVLHVCTTAVSLELLLGPQLSAFAAAGYDVVTASAPGPEVAAVEARGIRHVPLRHATRSMDVRKDAAALVELVRLFRAERPDIVHTHNPKPGWYGRIGAGVARVPAVVNTVHGLYAAPDDRWPKRTVVYALERLASVFSDVELIQNVEDRDTLRRLRVPEGKLEVLGNGIDLTRFTSEPVPAVRSAARAALGVTADEPIIGVVGRLVWEKGIREVLAAAERLRSTHPAARVIVIGPVDDAKADALSAADLPELERRSGVQFLGHRSDMEALYPAMDLFVLASHREGFPRAAMEAAAMGVPVVASDIRGCRQVVDDGVTGRLFPVRDADALAATVGALLDDPVRRRTMSEAARQKAVREFDQRRCIDLTLAAYDRLLGREGSPPS